MPVNRLTQLRWCVAFVWWADRGSVHSFDPVDGTVDGREKLTGHALNNPFSLGSSCYCMDLVHRSLIW
jgi:hypothetical protein